LAPITLGVRCRGARAIERLSRRTGKAWADLLSGPRQPMAPILAPGEVLSDRDPASEA
jgi:hypothetical protein